MKIKSILSLLCVLFLVVSHRGFATEQTQRTPESTVQQFYFWYLQKEDTQAFPVLDAKIFDFVCKATVDKLRSDYKNNKLDDVDYFTKVQDFDPKDWEANTVVAKPVITNNVAMTSVTFGSSDKVTVQVSLKQQGGVWKISKVDSAQK